MEEPVIEEAVEAAVEAPEPVVEEAAPSWSGPSQEEWEALNGTIGQLAQQFAPPPAEAPGIDSYFPPDPETGEATLTFEALDRYVQDRIEAGVNSRLGQFEPVLNQTVADRGEQLINQEFDKLASQGDFDRALARELAEGYASTGHAPDEAIRRGAQRAREVAQAAAQSAVDEYKKTLGNIGNAPREPGVNGAGLPDEEHLPTGHPDRYKQIADNWAARNRL